MTFSDSRPRIPNGECIKIQNLPASANDLDLLYFEHDNVNVQNILWYYTDCSVYEIEFITFESTNTVSTMSEILMQAER